MMHGPTIPCWLREHTKLDATDKYLYLCLLDVLGEEHLQNMLLGKGKEYGDFFCTIDFLLAHTGLDEIALFKSFHALFLEDIVYKYLSTNPKIWQIRITPWKKVLGIEQRVECDTACEAPQAQEKKR